MPRPDPEINGPGGPGGGQSGTQGSVGSTNRGNASFITGQTLRELKVLIRKLLPPTPTSFTGELYVLSIVGSGTSFVETGVGFIHWSDTGAYIQTDGVSSLIIGHDITIPGTLDVTGNTGFTGTLSVTGNVTLEGDLDVTGDLDAGFTLGSIVFQGASGLTQDNSNLFWADATNRLGLGTDSPQLPFHMKVTTAVIMLESNSGNNAFIRLRNGSSSKWAFGNDSGADKFMISTGTSLANPKFTVLQDGSVGIATTTPNSTQQVNGSVATTVTEASGTTTLDNTHSILNCTGSANFTVTLPTAVGINGRTYTIKVSGTQTITADGDGTETIDDETTQILTQYDALKIVSDGANWLII